jgi:hypothetical protein
MSALDEVRKLAVEVTGKQDVLVDVQSNEYGWHIVVYDGQLVESDGDGADEPHRFVPTEVHIVATGSGSTLGDACGNVGDAMAS